MNTLTQKAPGAITMLMTEAWLEVKRVWRQPGFSLPTLIFSGSILFVVCRSDAVWQEL